MEPIRLRSVRPFVWDEVSLLAAQDVDDVELDTKVKVNQFLKLKVTRLASAFASWRLTGSLARSTRSSRKRMPSGMLSTLREARGFFRSSVFE